MTDALDAVYSRRILDLAGNIPRIGELGAPDARGSAHSRLCGSTVSVTLCVEGETITNFAHQVRACALGQASASVMARNIVGTTAHELFALRHSMKAMLRSGGAAPDGRWQALQALEPVRAYPARHASTLLTFEAVANALVEFGLADPFDSKPANQTALRAGEPGWRFVPRTSASRKFPGMNRLGVVWNRLVDICLPPTVATKTARHWSVIGPRLMIRCYQFTLSALIGRHCRHLPTCSFYADEALARHGLWSGSWLAIHRLLRCGPGGTSGFDPVPLTLGHHIARHHPSATVPKRRND